MKPDKLKKILKNLRKGRVHKETAIDKKKKGNPTPDSNLNKRWEKVNPKSLKGIRKHIIKSRRSMKLYTALRDQAVKDKVEFTDADKLIYFASEYEGYKKILGKLV